jgi:uncharacterized damage-inducible protein DinB
MRWIAPDVERMEGPTVGSERQQLEGWLTYQRQTLLTKCAGLSGEDLARRAVAPSTLSLLGLVRHMADAERAWFRRHFGGLDLPEVFARPPDQRDAAFDEADGSQAEADYAALLQEIDMCDAAAAGASLEDEFVLAEWGPVSLRWVYNHMIEEYARHNGHADLLRQSIDGVTGQ